MDRTEVILSSEAKLVTYVNKKGERDVYPLATAMESTN
jgi:polo-like kinase 1